MKNKKLIGELKNIHVNIERGFYESAKNQLVYLLDQLDKDVRREDIRTLRAELDLRNAVSLLRDLADLQNGAPLVRYEKDGNIQWTACMGF